MKTRVDAESLLAVALDIDEPVSGRFWAFNNEGDIIADASQFELWEVGHIQEAYWQLHGELGEGAEAEKE